MITRIEVNGFKSLVNFKLPPDDSELSNFTCFVGLNGSGKSTVLQFLDFLRHLVRPNGVTEFLHKRGWGHKELTTHGDETGVIDFKVHFRFEEIGEVVWSASYSISERRCLNEKVRSRERIENISADSENQLTENLPELIKRILVELSSANSPEQGRDSMSQKPLVELEGNNENVRYESFFNSFIDVVRNSGFIEYEGSFMSFMSGDVMEKLSTQNHQSWVANIFQSVETILKSSTTAGFPPYQALPYLERRFHPQDFFPPEVHAVFSLSSTDQERVTAILTEFYENILEFNIKKYEDDSLEIFLTEQFGGGNEISRKTRGCHVSEGTLRIIFLLSHLFGGTGQSDAKPNKFVAFDEVENGINAEIMEKLANKFVESKVQSFVTTHSPVFLNCLDEDVAQKGVFLLYRDKEGITRATRMFDIPDVHERMDLLGPGEVFISTDLIELSSRLAAEASEEAKS